MSKCKCKIYCVRSGKRKATDSNGGMEFWCPYVPDAMGGKTAPACKMLDKNHKMLKTPLDKKL